MSAVARARWMRPGAHEEQRVICLRVEPWESRPGVKRWRQFREARAAAIARAEEARARLPACTLHGEHGCGVSLQCAHETGLLR